MIYGNPGLIIEGKVQRIGKSISVIARRIMPLASTYRTDDGRPLNHSTSASASPGQEASSEARECNGITTQARPRSSHHNIILAPIKPNTTSFATASNLNELSFFPGSSLMPTRWASWATEIGLVRSPPKTNLPGLLFRRYSRTRWQRNRDTGTRSGSLRL